MSRPLLTTVRKAVAKITDRFRVYDVIPPYDYVQNITETYLHDYLRRPRESVERILIVGGHMGHEVPRLLRSYPRCRVTLFEPSRRYQAPLTERYAREDRVDVEPYAVSDQVGELTFYETSLVGSGSILPLGDLARESYDADQAESFTVTSTTLDEYLDDSPVDCLWIDVQGAELHVLRGADKRMSQIASVFLEISILPDLYEGAVTFVDLDAELRRQGFVPALVGTDRGNLTGNALYVRP